jgi:hypothetical protein
MREIKFRGMDLQGRWFYGLVCHIQTDRGGYTPGWYISNSVGIPTAYPVRPETITQYTGLKDKDGREIYKGDIVTGAWGQPSPVVWAVAYSGPQWCTLDKNGEVDDFYGGIGGPVKINDDGLTTSVRVLGNIYENPELLNTDGV